MSEKWRMGFRRGFLAGMESPFMVFFSPQRIYDTGSKNVVADAWAEVGRAMRVAFDQERMEYENTARERPDTTLRD